MLRSCRSCGPAHAASNPSVSECEAQTRFERETLAAVEAYVEATNSGDAEAVADLYVDSPATGSIGDGQVYTGWSSVSDRLLTFGRGGRE